MIANSTIPEDSTTGTIPFTIGDPESIPEVLAVTAYSSNPTLVPQGSITLGGAGANRSVTVTPQANQSGSTTITLTVSDGALTSSTSFIVAVSAVNDAPTISAIADQTIAEDNALGPLAFTVGDVETLASGLTITASSSNPALVPLAAISVSGSGVNRTLTLSPASDQSGAATITLTVSDGALTSSTSFIVMVNAVNDIPTISTIADQTIAEDNALGPLAFTVGDVETLASGLTITVSSSNPALVPLAAISVSGSGADRTLALNPASDQEGAATITLTVSDGTLTSSTSFVVTVNAVNDPPTISAITDQTIDQDGSSTPIVVSIDDIDTPATSLTLSAASSNTTLIPTANIIFSGSGMSRTVTITPAPGQSGSANITLTVGDGDLSASTDFLALVDVQFSNDPPVITHPSDRTIPEDGTTGAIPFTIGDPETPAGALTLSASSNNTTLVPLGRISFGGSGGNRSITINPAANQSGTATITITASDGELSSSASFLVTVTPMADPPSIGVIADQVIDEDTTTGAVAVTIGDPDDTTGNSLTLTATSSNTMLVPLNNIVIGGSGNNRTATVTPAANQSGSTTITLIVADGTSTATTQFSIRVNPVNDAPTITSIADTTTDEDVVAGPLAFTIGDVETAPGALLISIASSNPALIPPANILLGGSAANRLVTITPAANQSGSATITLTVSDGSLSRSTSFLLTVRAVDDVPTIAPVADQTVEMDGTIGPLSVTIDDMETPAGDLNLTATSDNQALLPDARIVVGGGGATRTITLSPLSDQLGVATITLTVSDGQQSGNRTFRVDVVAASRTYGAIAVTADSYTRLPDGTIRAAGNIRLGDHLLLDGAGAELRIQPANNTISGYGTLRHVTGHYQLFSGDLTASGTTGLITPAGNVAYNLSELAGFPINGAFALREVRVADGVAAGATSLRLSPPGVQAAAAADFTIAPGPIFNGALGAFSIAAGGVTIEVGAGATLANDGVTVTSFTVKIPDAFGGARGTARGLHITPASLQLTSGSITLPEILIGDGSKLRLTGNSATLSFNSTTATYRFFLQSTLQITLPGNRRSIMTSLMFGDDGRGPSIAGTLSSLNLTIAGSSLAMRTLTLTNSGLEVSAATLTLPAALGGSVMINDVRITTGGLSIGGGSFSLPDIAFGGSGERLKVIGPVVSLRISGDTYTLSGSGQLRIRLPQNAPPDIALTFAIQSDATFNASLSGLALQVAGSTLKLGPITFSNSGLRASSATLTLPARFGGATAAVSNITITRDGLSLGSAELALNQDIRFGNGAALRISGARLRLVIAPTEYTFSASGTLHVSLPGNSSNTAIGFQFSSNGDIRGTVGRVALTIGGTSVVLQNLALSNSGLAVSEATITVRGVTGILRDIRIGEGGLSIGSQSIQLPRQIALAGDRVVLLQPRLSIQTTGGGYTLTLAGNVKLNLPQNGQTISNVTIAVSTNGQFSGSIGQVTLNLSQAQLVLNTVAITNDGLSVGTGTLRLPGNLGGASGGVTNVRITSSGLTIGGGTANIPFPTIRLGSSSGFAVTNVRGRIDILSNNSYRLGLSGTVQISIPGAQSSASGNITVDSSGAIGGTVNGFSLAVAGMSLGVNGVSISGNTLVANSASLAVPSALGGASIAVYNVRIAPGSGVSIGGGRFALPAIKAGDFTLGLQGELRRAANGYEITAGGTFGVPGIGSAVGCSGIAVSVTITTDGFGNTVLSIHEPRNDAEIAQVTSAVTDASHPQAVVTPAGVRLGQVSLTLNCQIPIGATGLFLSSASGTVTIGGGSTRIDVAVRIIAGRQIAGLSLLSADARAYLQTRPFEMGLSGSVKVFIFEVGGASATIKSNEFRANLYMQAVIVRGNISLRAWSDYRGFLFTGSGNMTVGVQRGQIFQQCAWGFCLSIPPFTVDIGSVWVDAGAFSNGAWGFKGNVSFAGYRAGVYIDTRGKVTFGNVDQYRLISAADVQAARARLHAGQSLAVEDADMVFPTADTVDVAVSVPAGKDLIVALARGADAPQLTLIAPSGATAKPGALPANITYHETISGTLGTTGGQVQQTYIVSRAEAGQWTLHLEGAAANDTYTLAVLGNNVPPDISEVQATQTGPLQADMGWRLRDDEGTAPISIWASTQPATDQEHTGLRVADEIVRPADGSAQHIALDLSMLPSGTYYLYAQADDGRNAPVRAYTATPITIKHPWVPTWDAQTQVTPGYRSLDIHWSAHPSPDIDGYRVTLSSEGTTQVITAGNILTATISSLTPGSMYTIEVSAYEDEGRTAQAAPVQGTPAGAPFDLTISTTTVQLVAGEQAQLNLNLTTLLDPYPEGVGLTVGAVPNGLMVEAGTSVLTPTMAGTVTSVTIVSSATTPTGIYRVPLIAQGVGASQTVVLEINVAGRTFTLTPSSATLTLAAGMQTSLTLSTAAVNGGNGPIHVSLEGTPVGLDYTFSADTIAPDSTITVVLSDTAALFGGTYALRLQASDDTTHVEVPLTLTVSKPGVVLSATSTSAALAPGTTRVLALDLSAVGGWTTPVSLSLDIASLPPVIGAGLALHEPASDTSMNVLVPSATLVLPASAWVVVTADANTPSGIYDLPVVVTSDGYEGRLILRLEVTANGLYTAFLPIVMK